MTPRRLVVLACVAVALVRLTYLGWPLRGDEAGYLMVAGQWHHDGPFAYGDYWVDRPPALLGYYWLAAETGWTSAVHLLTLPFSLLFVVSAAWAGHRVGGDRGARWGALVAAATGCTPLLAMDQAKGELLASALVMLSVTLLLQAVGTLAGPRRTALAAASGAAAATAPLFKQNFLDALVFAAVLLSAQALAAGRRRSAGRDALAFAAGASAMLAAFLLWAAAGPGLDVAWRDLVAFRGRGAAAILGQPSDRPLKRAVTLSGLSVLTGLLPACALLAAAAWRTRSPLSPVTWATLVTSAYAVLGMVGGMSFWPHYLVQLGPAAVLAAARLARHPARWAFGGGRVAVGLAVASGLGSWVGFATWLAADPEASWGERLGGWLAASAAPGDTGTVVHGSAWVLQSAGLRSPYPYLWSLPVRVHDPELELLEQTLEGPEAPTWVVQPTGWAAWGLDASGDLRQTLQRHYEVVAEVCGEPVWLHRGVVRDLAPVPAC